VLISLIAIFVPTWMPLTGSIILTTLIIWILVVEFGLSLFPERGRE